jgi:chemotaxis protein MotA
MDFASIIGIFWGVAMLLVGNALEGGSVKSMLGKSAFIIVIGGTSGAILLQFSIKTVMAALLGLKDVFLGVKLDSEELIHQIVEFARRARRAGFLALEKEIPNIQNPFFSKALGMAVDGLEPKTCAKPWKRKSPRSRKSGRESEVWEAAGGYLPTVGIIGRARPHHVMGNLSDIERVGRRVAAAFVATIYGVGAAIMICCPWVTTQTHRQAHRPPPRNDPKGVL